MQADRIAFQSLTKGDSLSPFPLTITKDDVSAYLEATGEPEDLWSTFVPPLMLTARMLGGLMEAVEVPGRLMHTGQEHQMHRSVHIGEPLSVTFSVASVGERHGAVFATFDAEARGAGGDLVATSRTAVMAPPADEPDASPSAAGPSE